MVWGTSNRQHSTGNFLGLCTNQENPHTPLEPLQPRQSLSSSSFQENAKVEAQTALTHIVYRDSVIRDLEKKQRQRQTQLDIEKDVSKRSDTRLVGQLVEEKGKRIALEMEIAERDRKRWSSQACIRNCQELRAVGVR